MNEVSQSIANIDYPGEFRYSLGSFGVPLPARMNTSIQWHFASPAKLSTDFELIDCFRNFCAKLSRDWGSGAICILCEISSPVFIIVLQACLELCFDCHE